MSKRIILKENWDLPPKILLEKGKEKENFKGYFVGRERELNLLVNEILHKNRGSILISGYRGVGKTSLVHKALSMALEKDKNILVVLMNAAQLEAEAQGEELNPKSIIENLIRRLYTAIRYREGLENKIKKHVENLYKKTVSKDFKLTESFIRRSERIEEDKEEIAREVLLDEKVLHIVIFIAFWTLGAIILTFNLTPWEWVNKLVALLSTFPIPYVVNLTYRKRKVRKERRKASLKTEELYQLDNKIGNLEFDLEQIHSEITSSNKEFPNGKKLVYVIDELDKLDRNMVMEVLKYFKNLFALSDALFIFIGGEELYNIGCEEVENSVLYRQKEYTYFISRYFLSRPLYPDLSTKEVYCSMLKMIILI